MLMYKNMQSKAFVSFWKSISRRKKKIKKNKWRVKKWNLLNNCTLTELQNAILNTMLITGKAFSKNKSSIKWTSLWINKILRQPFPCSDKKLESYCLCSCLSASLWSKYCMCGKKLNGPLRKVDEIEQLNNILSGSLLFEK